MGKRGQFMIDLGFAAAGIWVGFQFVHNPLAAFIMLLAIFAADYAVHAHRRRATSQPAPVPVRIEG